jgi:hypothetical protein
MEKDPHLVSFKLTLVTVNADHTMSFPFNHSLQKIDWKKLKKKNIENKCF